MSKESMVPPAPTTPIGSTMKPEEGTTANFARLKVNDNGGAGVNGGGNSNSILPMHEEGRTTTVTAKEKVFEIRDPKSSSSPPPSKNHGGGGGEITITGRTTAGGGNSKNTTRIMKGEREKNEIPSYDFSTEDSSNGTYVDGTFCIASSGPVEKKQQETTNGNPSFPTTQGVVPQAVTITKGVNHRSTVPSIVQRPQNSGGGAVATSPGKAAGGGPVIMNGANSGGDQSALSPSHLSATTGNGESNSPSSTTGEKNAGADVIDSALLSALSDHRERKGLLRLEQTLVDFMKERNAGYIEVGGPNNSIVINGQSGGVGNRNMVGETPQDGVLSQQQMQLVGDGGQQQQQHGGGGGGRGGRQTSFQRLCLHRLADRFNIVREPASTPLQASDGDGYNGGGVNGGSGVSYPPGLIRLVKVKNSRIPSKLLIDIDVSNGQNSEGGGRYYRGAGGSMAVGRGLVNPETGEKIDDGIQMRGVPESLSSCSSHGENSKSIQKQPPKKMMIMKRSSSGLGSSGSLKSKGDDRGKGRNKGKALKGKNLSDKEKAYEEARARIFNETQCSEQNQEAASDLPTPIETPQRAASPSSSASRTSESGTANSEDQQNSAISKSSPAHQKPQSQDVNEGETNGGITQESPSPSGSFASSSYQQQQQVPAAAATDGAVSKVTWRNRRQEENDPDFRRRGTVRVPVTVGVGLGAPSSIAVVNPMHSGIHMTSAAAHYGGPIASAPTAAAPGSFQGIPTMIVHPTQQQHVMTSSSKNGNVFSSQQSQQHYYTSQTNATSSGTNGSDHRHQQQHQQVQAATAAYYAQQHAAAAAYYAHSHQQQQQHHHHHRSHSPNVSGGGGGGGGGGHPRHQHHMQQSRGTGGGAGYSGGGSGGQYISQGARHWGKHGSDIGSNGNGRRSDSNPQPAATAAANVYNMDEFPALR